MPLSKQKNKKDSDSDSSEKQPKKIIKKKTVKKNIKIIVSDSSESSSDESCVPIKKLKMIDLCAGTGAFSHAFESTNKIEVVFSNDIEPSSKLMYDANFDHELTLGNICEMDVKTIPKHDILTAGFPCFIAGTKVQTYCGYKNIENIILSDKLMTHTGIFQNILNLQNKIYTGDLYTIKLKYHPNNIICTSEHPFYVRYKVKIWNSSIKRYTYLYGDPEWKVASKLTKNDHFGMIINRKSIIPNFTFNGNDITLNKKEYWYMLGYFVGSGWIGNTLKTNDICDDKIKFTINRKYIGAVIKKILPMTYKKCDIGPCEKFGCGNLLWYNIFKQFGKYAHEKLIPEWVQNAPKKFIQEFINGYMKASGCINKRKILQITTVSHNLALGLQRLYLKLGHIFSINKCKRSTKCIIEGKIVDQTDTFCIRGALNKLRKQSSFIDGNYAWFESRSINKKMIKNVKVYNFEVENDNSYIVENTIVHNCQPFSIAGKQKGFDDPRSNVFWKIIEIAKYHKPKCIVLENVKNLESHDNGDTLKTIKKSLKKEKYHIIHKVLNTSTITTIPQHRERLYIVCVKDPKILDEFNLDFPKVKKQKISALLTNKKVDNKYYYNNEDNKIHKMVLDAVVDDETVYQFRRIYVRENKNNECPTLTANMGSGGHNVPIILDDNGPRKLIPKECFNFQGFPKKYILPKMSDCKLYKLAGNAVSVPVVKLIIDRLIKYLFLC